MLDSGKPSRCDPALRQYKCPLSLRRIFALVLRSTTRIPRGRVIYFTLSL
jgi:hypothetical protein